ncbi:N-succinylarginine dihydrolase [Sphingobium herbicidovorans NBRC 16415]|uniref:N-succinylarginine dihydrolase n=1 Tax=Sphingobium herbicidovorans (strain ATCC 700291 / DSM 11019 / CCUG 56400 / KCTC 2939 / LMG 18315 / NBRC 16415 / MH) TaxID=1219045 RepID=A0A086P5K9_SPHHM|nr:N-succinylarginine dihydrolase [Sphingobium herbicidovorans]KFG88677.1 N-succinylarginine dihydrolase [Sphingobium herbicidovorans NBRC 16415]
MTVREINFDGLIGPSHNYAGLSLGNLASARNAGTVSHPRAAALQGIEKMRTNLQLGIPQGIFLPQWRPDGRWLSALGTNISDAEPAIRAAAMSASSMWAANAATVSPAADASDGRTHLTVANLVTMPHRSHEWPQTLAQLKIAFSDRDAFVIHPPVPAPFGDEGAANHMRLSENHACRGVEIFAYGQSGGPFPARQHLEASKAIARLHCLDPARTLFAMQSEEAIAAGAFHNDVVAVANENVLFAHEKAFADKERLYTDLQALLPSIQIIEVPDRSVSLADAIRSYLFNAQLVTLAEGGMALILPTEARNIASVWDWLEQMTSSNGPIRRLITVDIRQSMANGGGPACLRLRVVADPANIDPRFLVNEAKLDDIADIVSRYWPEEITPGELADTRLIAQIEQSWLTLVDHLQLSGDLIP